ncbi:MAG: type I DNA topoisomerase [Bradymonadaceae bacterium]
MSKLVVVESPAKADTIENYLPGDYTVRASYGHIRDLPENKSDLPEKYQDEPWAKLGVDVDGEFEPVYVIPNERSREAIGEIQQAVDRADTLLLATDEDREGEAISWHLAEVLDVSVPVRRMVFHEITRTAIQEALRTTRDLDLDLVEAQEARRILDRLVGYPLSLLVSQKIRYGLSAGRVQSVAVRLLVDRERARRAFTSGAYWDLRAELARNGAEEFRAELRSLEGTRLANSKDFDRDTGQIEEGKDVVLLDEEQADELREELSDGAWRVESIGTRRYTTSPKPPFITSTLQQEANRKLGLSASATMSIAQDLYENGFITYMRTDSVNLSQQAISAARKAAGALYGPEYVRDAPRNYSSDSDTAQEAHEAIRPTGDDFVHPDESGLSGRARQLYELIWKRTVACQMAEAEKTSFRVDLTVVGSDRDVVFRANDNRIDFAGFISAYVQGADDPTEVLDDADTPLSALEEGDEVDCRSIETVGHETKPPRRYTEASLVDELETQGVGRPSTYATIMGKITRDDRYARKHGKTLVPTYTGFAVTELLEEHFSELVDVGFTARMEDDLDAVARGEMSKVEYLHRFYRQEGGFADQIERGEETIDPDEARRVDLAEFPGTLRVGRYGPYVEVEGEDETITVDVPEEVAPADLEWEEIEQRVREQQRGPRHLGDDPETGAPIYAKNGPYGPYVQRGEDSDSDPERASIPDQMDPERVDLDRACALLALPRRLGEHPDGDGVLEAGIGRYGPYVRHRVDGDADYENLDEVERVFEIGLDEAVELLDGDRSRKNVIKKLGKDPDSGETVRVLDGRYGPYVKLGETNASVPNDKDPEKVTMDQAMRMIEEKRAD